MADSTVARGSRYYVPYATRHTPGMIIGIDASRANAGHRTGTEWYSYHIIQGLAALDRENRYLLYTPEPFQEDLARLPENFSSRVLSHPLGFLWTQLRLSFEMAIRPPDVLFVPAHTVPLVTPPRTVVTIHDLGFEHFPELYGRDPIGPTQFPLTLFTSLAIRIVTGYRYGNSELDYHRWSLRFAAGHAAKIIAVSEYTKQDIVERLNVPSDNVVVIPHGVDHERYHPHVDRAAIESARARHGLSTPYLLFIGRLERKKNVARLIRAFSMLTRARDVPHNLRLVLVGEKGVGFPEILKTIREERVGQFVTITGWQGDDARLLLAGATCFMFPSLFEGFGLPVLEAMAMGVPVVCSNTTALPEVAGDATLLVDPGSTESIAQGIHRVLEDEALRRELVAKGLARAKNYTWEKTVRKTHEILISLV